MKSYLSLIPISAKIRKRQNRMTLLCIVISVFLVTAIFSVADMLTQTENDILTDKHGSWHLKLDGISSETADEISKDPDVVSVGMESHFNEDGDGDYRLNGKRVVIYGINEIYLDQNSDGIRSGNFPANDQELLLGPGAAEHYQIQTGDTLTFTSPSGETDFKVSGIGGVDETFYTSLYSMVDMYVTPSAFQALMQAAGQTFCAAGSPELVQKCDPGRIDPWYDHQSDHLYGPALWHRRRIFHNTGP